MHKLLWHQSSEHTREGVCRSTRQQDQRHHGSKGNKKHLRRQKRSCIGQMFTVGQLGEKIIEKNKRMAMVCVDLKKPYTG